MTIDELAQQLYAYIDEHMEKVKLQLFYNQQARKQVTLEKFEQMELQQYSGFEFIKHETIRLLLRTLQNMWPDAAGIFTGYLDSIEALDNTDVAGVYAVNLENNHSSFGVKDFSLLVLPFTDDGGAHQMVAYVKDSVAHLAIRSGFQGSWQTWSVLGGVDQATFEQEQQTRIAAEEALQEQIDEIKDYYPREVSEESGIVYTMFNGVKIEL
jgi:hypothetical protein